MKVIALCGSPRKNGNTYFALSQIGKVLQDDGIEYEIIEVGGKHIRGCMECNKCAVNRDEKCVITDDFVNEVFPKMKIADGIIISSPVYYSGIAGTMKCFLDRAFYVSAVNGNCFRHKVGASVVAVRRTGGTMTFDDLNHYLMVSEMFIASSGYWNVVHGLMPGDAAKDENGMHIMNTLAKNIAWMIKMRKKANELEFDKDGRLLSDILR